jgi:hypothetical protein
MIHYDIGRHNQPHIHVEYQEFEAVYSIPDGELLAGELPRRQRNKVGEWIEQYQDELMKNWQLAVTGEKLFRVDPLD